MEALVVIIAVLPFELDGLGNEVLANLVVDVGLVCLTELEAPWHTVHLSILDEACSCLVETKSDVFGYALFTHGKNPVVVARACIKT